MYDAGFRHGDAQTLLTCRYNQEAGHDLSTIQYFYASGTPTVTVIETHCEYRIVQDIREETPGFKRSFKLLFRAAR